MMHWRSLSASCLSFFLLLPLFPLSAFGQSSFAEAERYVNEKREDQASAAFEALLVQNPYQGQYFFRKGRTLYETGRYAVVAYTPCSALGYSPKWTAADFRTNHAPAMATIISYLKTQNAQS